MAYLPIAEVLDKKYITDTAIACALKRGELTLDDDVVKHHIYQVGAYQAVYNADKVAEKVVDDPTTSDVDEHQQAIDAANAAKEAAEAADADMINDLTQDDGNDTNDIKFKVNNTDYSYEGDPAAAMKVALTSLGLDPKALYVDEEKKSKLVVKNKTAEDLKGLVLYAEAAGQETETVVTDPASPVE